MRHPQHVEDSEAARLLKRRLDDILFAEHLRVNEMAAKLNISAERGYKYLNEASLNNNLPAYLIPLWTRMIGPQLLSMLNHDAGYVAVPLPTEQPSVESALQATAMVMKECGEAIQSVSNALTDGAISGMEWRAFQQEVRETLEALVTLEQVVERMRR